MSERKPLSNMTRLAIEFSSVEMTKGRGTAQVERRLRAFQLQALEDARELRGLLVVEIELEGEEAQRTSHAETRARDHLVLFEAPM